MTTISLGAKKFGTDLGMKAPAKRSTKHKIMAPTFPKALFTFLDFCISISLTICAITVLLVIIAYSFNVNIETSSLLNRKIYFPIKGTVSVHNAKRIQVKNFTVQIQLIPNITNGIRFIRVKS